MQVVVEVAPVLESAVEPNFDFMLGLGCNQLEKLAAGCAEYEQYGEPNEVIAAFADGDELRNDCTYQGVQGGNSVVVQIGPLLLLLLDMEDVLIILLLFAFRLLIGLMMKKMMFVKLQQESNYEEKENACKDSFAPITTEFPIGQEFEFRDYIQFAFKAEFQASLHQHIPEKIYYSFINQDQHYQANSDLHFILIFNSNSNSSFNSRILVDVQANIDYTDYITNFGNLEYYSSRFHILVE
ncbi:MAG: hypothetical protein EZS28_016062 [Streblomastix strix]|uniref:Uncharacterized protein n=1 Tax=Streblomastix strix TaxID=222440 RepID=A0A5J4W0U7_9EUKA|nr:MAG: hypothetical protein EZS28_016062 [Streblomastix strix]